MHPYTREADERPFGSGFAPSASVDRRATRTGVRSSFAALFAACTIVVTSSGCASCGQCALGALQGPINDPSNRALRRDILSYGISQFCPEMLKHNAPLALQAAAPSIGRFYPRSCSQQSLANGDLYVQFSGVGYAWTNISKRISFTMQGTVTYDPDFLMDGCTAYAYFRTRQVQGSNFQILKIEQPIADILNQLTPYGSQFGQQLVSAQLAQGFTVIREGNGNADFGLGMIPRGQRPVHPIDLHGSNKLVYENNTTEIHSGQRDFIGPIVVDDTGRALYINAQLQGVSAIDIIFMRREDAEPWLDQYIQSQLPPPLMAMPIGGDVIQANVPYRRAVPVPPGAYYVILDNTPSAGQVAPQPQVLLSDPAANVGYSIEIGDQ